jgi:prepilin peptidase dependent protein B
MLSFAGTRRGKRVSAGVSLIELMVGMAVGLVIVGGAVLLFTSNVVNGRKILVETRVNQNLRSAADLIVRDLRRAGYWANAINGVIATGTGTATMANAYRPVSATCGVANSQITYGYATDSNNALDTAEQFGFRLNNGAIEMKVDGAPTWQPVTDADVMTVTKFQCTETKTAIAAGSACSRGCNTTPPTSPAAPTTACPNPPAITVTRYEIVMEATARSDAAVKRTLKESVLLRNDQLSGSCPA